MIYLDLMITNPSHIFKDIKCISEFETEYAIYRIYDNNIFYVVIKKHQKASMEIVNDGYDFINENGGGKFYNIYEFESFSDVDPEVRSWAAQDSGNNYTIIDAIVITSLAQKIIANFYLKFNKPDKPTRIFTNLENGLNWVLEYIENEKG